MQITSNKLIEYIYFFLILILSGYFVLQLLSPLITALALAAIVAVICYPLYERILVRIPRQNKTVASLISLCIVIVTVVLPLTFISSLILKEALSIYTLVSDASPTSFTEPIERLEGMVQMLIPSFSIDMVEIIKQTAQFFVDHIVSIFAGTASTIFLFFIALIATYYFFKDGQYFTRYIVSLSPLNDTHDTMILTRLAQAVRAVALGTVAVALIQGMLTALGFTIFGFDRAILWGCVAALGALVPGVGTAIVFIPAIVYLFVTGSYVSGVLLLLWGVIAVGLIDNLLGPHLMGKGNNMHPMVVLLSVLGGISLMGPIGFILGPVVMSLFLVLLELYSTRILEKRGLL